MIKLNFGEGNLAAHQQLIEIISTEFEKRTKLIRDSYEYRTKIKKISRPLTLGEIDFIASYKGNLVLIEVKTNNDLKDAVRALKSHQQNISLILERLPKKLTAGIYKLTYLAVIYELYMVYKLEENGELKELCPIDEFLEKLPIS